MRLDAIALLWGAVILSGWSLLAPVGPTWAIWVSWVGALGFAWVTRQKKILLSETVKPAVLIPTHNNAGEVGKVVEKCLPYAVPVFVVDDGSKDGSGKEANAAGAVVLTHEKNQGKGAALLTGMKRLAEEGYTHAICLDADGQHEPSDIPSYVAAISGDPRAIWAGVRDLSTAPGKSRFGRRFSNFWVWVETGWRLADTQCGFRSYPIPVVLGLGLGGSRYDLEVEVLTRSIWAGFPVKDIPCQVYYPPPELRVSSFAPFKDNARISWMNTRLFLERILWPGNWWVIRQAR